MKWFWKLAWWSTLIGLLIFLLFVGFCLEQLWDEWTKPMEPFVKFLRDTAIWVFVSCVLSKLDGIWDKAQSTLNALLASSNRIEQKLARLEERVADAQQSTQRTFTW